MRRFTVILDERASRQLDRIRGRGPTPALDAALAKTFTLLQACPEMGPPAQLGGRWSPVEHRIILGESGYLLFYRVNPSAELVIVRAVRHERQRPLRRL